VRARRQNLFRSLHPGASALAGAAEAVRAKIISSSAVGFRRRIGVSPLVGCAKFARCGAMADADRKAAGTQQEGAGQEPSREESAWRWAAVSAAER